MCGGKPCPVRVRILMFPIQAMSRRRKSSKLRLKFESSRSKSFGSDPSSFGDLLALRLLRMHNYLAEVIFHFLLPALVLYAALHGLCRIVAANIGRKLGKQRSKVLKKPCSVSSCLQIVSLVSRKGFGELGIFQFRNLRLH